MSGKPASPELPIFEVHESEKHYSIYADGRVTGFDPEASIIKRIPIVLEEMKARYSTSCQAVPRPDTSLSPALEGFSQGAPE
jgi:hypothetical protein